MRNIFRSITCYIRGLSKNEYAMLREMCDYANNLYNKALYEVRQHFFREKKLLRYQKNYHRCKLNENYRMLATTVAVQTLRWADASFKSFLALLKLADSGKYDPAKVKLPHYRKKGELAPLNIQVSPTTCSTRHGMLIVPQSKTFFEKHDKHRIRIKIPPQLVSEHIKHIIIIPVANGRAFKIQYIYTCEPEVLQLNPDHCLSVDIGLDNLAACVDSCGTAFIMDGRKIKSINHRWNKLKARLQSVYTKQGIYSGRKLDMLTLKRNEQIQDIFRKSARYIINYCIAHDIGTLVAGCNPLWKDSINLGRVNNQNFVQVPFAYLRLLLKFHCQRYGIAYIEQEESYTSKASFLDLDDIPVYDGRTKHKFSGVRVKRGLYRSGNGTLINADVNGAANILRKSKQNLNYERLCTGLITCSPARIRVLRSTKLLAKNYIIPILRRVCAK